MVTVQGAAQIPKAIKLAFASNRFFFKCKNVVSLVHQALSSLLHRKYQTNCEQRRRRGINLKASMHNEHIGFVSLSINRNEEDKVSLYLTGSCIKNNHYIASFNCSASQFDICTQNIYYSLISKILVLCTSVLISVPP